MSALTLEDSLRARGIACRVEALDRLALIVPEGPVAALEEATLRREIVGLVRDHGFTHLALELVAEPGGDAPLHRD